MTIITEESSFDPQQPSHITVPMFQHQLRVLHAANIVEENGSVPLSDDEDLRSTVGFICCPPGKSKLAILYLYQVITLGAGKSLVVLALSNSPPNRPSPSGKSFVSGSTVTKNTVKLGTIVVVPDFIIEQWRTYVAKTFDIESNIENNVKLLIVTPNVYQVLAGKYR
jgi:hypothetical protein